MRVLARLLLVAAIALVLAAAVVHAQNWFVLGPGYVPSPSVNATYVNQTVYPGNNFVGYVYTTSDVNYAIVPVGWSVTSGTAYTYESAASSSSGGSTWFYGTSGTVSNDYLIALSVSSTYNVAFGYNTGTFSTYTQYAMAVNIVYVPSETSATLYAHCDVDVSTASTDYRVVYFGNATWAVIETYETSTSGAAWDSPAINLGTYTLSPGWYLFACSVYDSSGADIEEYGTAGVSTSSSSFTALGTQYYVGVSISGTLVMPFVTTTYQPLYGGSFARYYYVVNASGSSTSGAFLVRLSSTPSIPAFTFGGNGVVSFGVFNATVSGGTIQGVPCYGNLTVFQTSIPPSGAQLLSCNSLTSPSSGFAIYPVVYGDYYGTPSTATINFYNPSGQAISSYPSLTVNDSRITYAYSYFSNTAYQLPQCSISSNPYGGATGTYGLLGCLAIQYNGTWAVIRFYYQSGDEGVILSFSTAQYSSSPSAWVPWVYIGTNGYLYVGDANTGQVSFPLSTGWHTLIVGEYFSGGTYYVVAYLDRTSNTGSVSATSISPLFGHDGPYPYDYIGVGYSSDWTNTAGGWWFYTGYIQYIAVYAGNSSTLENDLLNWLNSTGGDSLPPFLGSPYGPYALYVVPTLQAIDISGYGNTATLVGGTSPASVSYSILALTPPLSFYIVSGRSETLGVTPNTLGNNYYAINTTSFTTGSSPTYYVPDTASPYAYVGSAFLTSPTLYMDSLYPVMCGGSASQMSNMGTVQWVYSGNTYTLNSILPIGVSPIHLYTSTNQSSLEFQNEFFVTGSNEVGFGDNNTELVGPTESPSGYSLPLYVGTPTYSGFTCYPVLNVSNGGSVITSLTTTVKAYFLNGTEFMNQQETFSYVAFPALNALVYIGETLVIPSTLGMSGANAIAYSLPGVSTVTVYTTVPQYGEQYWSGYVLMGMTTTYWSGHVTWVNGTLYSGLSSNTFTPAEVGVPTVLINTPVTLSYYDPGTGSSMNMIAMLQPTIYVVLQVSALSNLVSISAKTITGQGFTLYLVNSSGSLLLYVTAQAGVKALTYELLNATQGLISSGSITAFPAIINLSSFTQIPTYIYINSTWMYPLIQVISNIAQNLAGNSGTWLGVIINGEFGGSTAAQLAGEIIFWLVFFGTTLTVRKRHLPIAFVIELLLLFLLSALGITPPGAAYVNLFLMVVFMALIAWFATTRKW